MTQRHANNFMNCAERFGKMENVFHFQPSQLMTLLALPAEETEKFIAEEFSIYKISVHTPRNDRVKTQVYISSKERLEMHYRQNLSI